VGLFALRRIDSDQSEAKENHDTGQCKNVNAVEPKDHRRTVLEKLVTDVDETPSAQDANKGKNGEDNFSSL
jgi:hypothetical protein